MSHFMQCEGYTGAVYLDPEADQIPFVAPEGQVGLHSLVYVKGVGISYRVTAVPGSYSDAWYRETEEYVCRCAVPAVWHFTGIDGTNVVTHDTLDVHEALHLMGHPDHIFDPDWSGSGLRCDLVLVPEEAGLLAAVRELTGYLSDKGVDGMMSDDDIRYDELSGFDADEFARQIFGENDGQS